MFCIQTCLRFCRQSIVDLCNLDALYPEQGTNFKSRTIKYQTNLEIHYQPVKQVIRERSCDYKAESWGWWDSLLIAIFSAAPIIMFQSP
jgi:hypothetical protein